MAVAITAPARAAVPAPVAAAVSVAVASAATSQPGGRNLHVFATASRTKALTLPAASSAVATIREQLDLRCATQPNNPIPADADRSADSACRCQVRRRRGECRRGARRPLHSRRCAAMRKFRRRRCARRQLSRWMPSTRISSAASVNIPPNSVADASVWITADATTSITTSSYGHIDTHRVSVRDDRRRQRLTRARHGPQAPRRLRTNHARNRK